MAKQISRKISIYIDGSPVENTLKGIQKELSRLRNVQKNATIGSEEYLAATKKIEQLNGILADQRESVKKLGEEWSQTKKHAVENANLLMGARSSVQMAAGAYSRVTGAMREYVEEAASMDDAYALVMKTTGLTHDEVLELNEAFKRMDTRTSREALNRIAHEAGKLGITGVESVESFVAAADQIGVALGDDLGEGAMVAPGEIGCYGASGFSGCSGDNGVSGLSGGCGVFGRGAAPRLGAGTVRGRGSALHDGYIHECLFEDIVTGRSTGGEMVMPSVQAPAKSAPQVSARSRQAPVRSASRKRAYERSASAKLAPRRLQPLKSAATRVKPSNTAPGNAAPQKRWRSRSGASIRVSRVPLVS